MKVIPSSTARWISLRLSFSESFLGFVLEWPPRLRTLTISPVLPSGRSWTPPELVRDGDWAPAWLATTPAAERPAAVCWRNSRRFGLGLGGVMAWVSHLWSVGGRRSRA